MENKVLSYLKSLFPINSVADFGCGTGKWLKAAENLGISDIRGVDKLNLEQTDLDGDKYLQHDLNESVYLGKKYDLVICLGLAGYIRADAENTLFDSLCWHGDLILFSSPIVGQNFGRGGVREQFHSYWEKKFDDEGYVLADILRPKYWEDSEVSTDFKQNALLFVNRSNQELLAKVDTAHRMVDVIHVDYYKSLLRHSYNMGQMCEQYLKDIDKGNRANAELLFFAIQQALKMIDKYDHNDKDLLLHFKVQDVRFCADKYEIADHDAFHEKIVAYYRHNGENAKADEFINQPWLSDNA